MYVRVARMTGADPETTVPALRENLLPALERLEGYQGGYWAAGTEKNGIGLTFFDSKQHLEASRATADQLRSKIAEKMGTAPPEFEEYEVLVSTGDKVHRNAGAMRIVHLQGDLNRSDEAAGQIRDRAIPKLQEFEGFLGGVWMVDRSTGKGLTILLWDKTESIDKNIVELDEFRERMMAGVGAKTTSTETWPILLHAEAPAAAQR